MAKRPAASQGQARPQAAPAGRLSDTAQRIAAALERLAPAAPARPDFSAADAFVWHPDGRRLAPVRGSIASRCRC